MSKTALMNAWPLTETEIAALPASRDMDALIGEHVLAYRWAKVPRDVDGKNGESQVLAPHGPLTTMMYLVLPPRGPVHPAYFVREYSRNLEDALALAETALFERLHFDIRIDRIVGAKFKWHVGAQSYAHGLSYHGGGDELPLAICRCVLQVAARGYFDAQPARA